MIPTRSSPSGRALAWTRRTSAPRLEQGVLFCQVGDPTKLDAVLVVDQADRNLIQEGQAVNVKLEGYPAPSMTRHSKIKEVAESELKITPKRMSTQHPGGEVPTKTDQQTGVQRPMSTSYQARVPIDDPAGQYRLGLFGQARVYTRWLPLGTRLWRLISHTF